MPDTSNESPTPEEARFGTFGGVFVPTLLTILGAILFLREGWVVGNAGLLGGWLIILLAFVITACTGLAMASFVTNIRVGRGGAFSMISQSLGLEVGGSIGVPLYIAQALAVTLYIFGFREGWLWFFPDHPALVVDLGVFAVIFIITIISTRLAVRVQYLILMLIAAALFSVAMAAWHGSMQHDIVWWGDFPGAPEDGFPGTSLWVVFAVFFPAATGIMAGANMSGDLRNPRRSIPLGTLAAIGVSLLVYLLIAYWLVRSATPDELVSNYTLMADLAEWNWLVVVGLLAATFSSALVSFVGAPRILQALAEHRLLPRSDWLAHLDRGEPLHATGFTSLIVLGALLLRDINSVAPLITLFFLISYAAINLIVLIEQRLGLASFRPLFRIPRYVPLVGLLGCGVVMFIINPLFSLVALIFIVVIYVWLLQRHIEAPFGDVRSGLFLAIAEWAARRVKRMQVNMEKAWKPHLLISLDNAQNFKRLEALVRPFAIPNGSVKLLGLGSSISIKMLRHNLSRIKDTLRDEGLFTTSGAVVVEDQVRGVVGVMQTLSGAIFRPNLLLLELPGERERWETFQPLLVEAAAARFGVVLVVLETDTAPTDLPTFNLWLRDQGPEWDVRTHRDNIDLALLLAGRLHEGWDAEVNLAMAVESGDDLERAEAFLAELVDYSRLPAATRFFLAKGGFERLDAHLPPAKLNIFPLGKRLDSDYVTDMCRLAGGTCLFVRDGGGENALA